jgi:hypothetical protein
MISVKDLTDDVAAAVRGRVPLEEQILTSLHEKEFSRSAVTDTATEVGGLNRGTVAEYLRGELIRAFVEHRFDVEMAVRAVSLSAEVREGLKPKTKNFPQRYHQYLEEAAEAYFRGLWQLPAEPSGGPGGAL